jgi:NADPH:quinone reductase
MKAVQISKTGGVEVLEYKDLPVPTLKDNEILVKNDFAGVNFIDTYFRTGLYKHALPLTLGREGAGTVVKTTSSRFKEGDKVVYMYAEAGSYANYSAINADQAVHLSAGLTTKMAAASLLQGLTAWTFIREAGAVKKDMWVLVHAAAGGVGTQLVQMLKSVGAKVIGTAGSPDKCELVRKNGVDHVVQSRGEDIPARVKAITGGHGVDVIFDGIGKATFDMDLEMIAMKGTIVIYGNAVRFPHSQRFSWKQLLTNQPFSVWCRSACGHPPPWPQERQDIAAHRHRLCCRETRSGEVRCRAVRNAYVGSGQG